MRKGEREQFDFLLTEIVANGLRDQDRLDGASNYVIWKAKISCLLDEHDLKAYVDSVVVEIADADPLKKYKVEIVQPKQLILDKVKDHVVCHIVGKWIAKEMWDALAKLYQGSSEQRKMYLEEKMRSTRMQKRDNIDLFLSKLQEVRDQLAVVGSAPQPIEMLRLALNSISKEWKAFLQSILGREKLSNWEGMWAALQ